MVLFRELLDISCEKRYNTYESTFFCTRVKYEGAINMNINDRIEKLENSPIYAMSLGSKELFHSNFWAWLMRRNPYLINVFFDDLIKNVEVIKDDDENINFKIGDNTSVRPEELVKREDNHKDIAIHFDNKVYVIENKIKTLPYREQLLKYQYSTKGFEKGCYTGLIDPKFKEDDVLFEINKSSRTEKFENTIWHFLSYETIASKIKNELLNERSGKFFNYLEKSIIMQYCCDIANVNFIICNKLNDEFEFEADKELAEVQLDDVYKKIKSDILKEKILEKLGYSDGQKITGDFIFRVETAYSHKQPSISFKFVYNNPKNDKVTDIYSFGIQIQNGGIRRYAETKVGKMKNFKGENNGYDGFFEAFANDGWFDKEFEKGKTLLSLHFCGNETRSLTTNMSPQTDKKKNKNSAQYNAYKDFVYQYYNISDKEKSDIGALTDEIRDNLKYAEHVLGEAENIFKKFSEE